MGFSFLINYSVKTGVFWAKSMKNQEATLTGSLSLCLPTSESPSLLSAARICSLLGEGFLQVPWGSSALIGYPPFPVSLPRSPAGVCQPRIPSSLLALENLSSSGNTQIKTNGNFYDSFSLISLCKQALLGEEGEKCTS